MKTFRLFIISALLLFAGINGIGAQESRKLCGHVVNENGAGIEYVHIRIPGDTIFTISDVNGYFTLDVPYGKSEDILFSHVSYEAAYLSPEQYYSINDSITVPMTSRTLPDVIVKPFREKAVTILGKGMKIASSSFSTTNSSGGISQQEWGSIVTVRRLTRVDRAELEAKLLGDVDRIVLSFVIYRTDREEKEFTPVQYKPVYQTLTREEGMKNMVFEESETLILDPGKYYFAIKFVEFDGAGTMQCNLYFKKSYDRLEDMNLPVSLGLQVLGTELKEEK